ncbi:MAG: hypothetical protein OXL36_18730, partial [Bryobacterales bacterium]|nr:hypothetical protein [Bryobacterales bacterium]
MLKYMPDTDTVSFALRGLGNAATRLLEHPPSEVCISSITLACISHHMTAGARDTTARTSLRLLAVLNVLSSTPARAKRRAPRPDGPLTHSASPRGEKCRLGVCPTGIRAVVG